MIDVALDSKGADTRRVLGSEVGEGGGMIEAGAEFVAEVAVGNEFGEGIVIKAGAECGCRQAALAGGGEE